MYIDVYEIIDNEKTGAMKNEINKIFDKSQLKTGISEYLDILGDVARPENLGANNKFKEKYRKFYKMTRRSYDDKFIEKYFKIMNEHRNALKNKYGSEYKLSNEENEETLKDIFIKVLYQLHNVGSKFKNGKRNHRYF